MGDDEAYVIDLCDRVLGETAIRQHRFDFLQGDAGTRLPVDAYYPGRKLVVEYHEKQHFESVKFFDEKETVSGVSRGKQRLIYDQRRREALPENGISLIVLEYIDFEHNGRKRLLRTVRDMDIVKEKLAEWLYAPEPAHEVRGRTSHRSAAYAGVRCPLALEAAIESIRPHGREISG